MNSAKPHGCKRLPPVNYDMLTPRFMRVRGQGETVTERTVIYRVSTRVTDSVTGAPIRKGQKFKIKREKDQEEIEVEVLNDFGMISWTDTLHHQYYQPEQFYKQHITITHVNSNSSETHTLYLNPWDSGWTFGLDKRAQNFSFSDAQLENKVPLLPPRLMVDAFRYQTIRFRYVIDKYLTLNVKKAVVMALDPLIQKQTIKEGRRFEPLRDGIYLAKVGLVKYYIDPFKAGLKLKKNEKGEYDIYSCEPGENQRWGGCP